MIDAANPLPLLSLNFLGIGFDFSYGETINGFVFTLQINYLFGWRTFLWRYERDD